MMLDNIYYLEPNIMNVIRNFHIETKESRRRKQRESERRLRERRRNVINIT